MKSGIEHNVKDIGESMMSNLARQATDTENKVFVMYCYNDDKGIDYTLRTLSNDPLVKDDFTFVGMQNPSQNAL